ncbi:MAG TPA: hypothetical protein VF651_07320 [Gammaproteobacteria bacterium]
MPSKLSLTGLILLAMIGCASAPAGPYWEDPAWLETFKQSLHLAYPWVIQGGDRKAFKATVGISYVDGKFTSVGIVESSGNPEVDRNITSQIRYLPLPEAEGPEKMEARDIQVEITLMPSTEDIASVMRQAVTNQAMPALREEWSGDHGYVMVGFSYLDGMISDVEVLYNDDIKRLGDSVVKQVSRVRAPLIPSLAGQRMHFTVGFCFRTTHVACREAQQRADGTLH